MSWQATAWALSQRVGLPARKLVLLVLATYADKHGICWPSQETLAEKTGMSVDSIQRHAKKLKELGLLSTVRPPKRRGQWQTLVYQLSMPTQTFASQHLPSSESPQASCASENDRSRRNSAIDGGERHPRGGSAIEAADRLAEKLCSFNQGANRSAGGQKAPQAVRARNITCGLAMPHLSSAPDRTALRLKPSKEPIKKPSATIRSPEALERLQAFRAKQESPEVTQDRIARRLGGAEGWMVLGELSEPELERLTALERHHRLDDETLRQAVLVARDRRSH
jgi:DNA-binding transcriptional ArsR family regulator